MKYERAQNKEAKTKEQIRLSFVCHVHGLYKFPEGTGFEAP
jgi:hypothetical protein